MIDYINGILAEVTSQAAVVEAGGVGYYLSMSTKALSSLPARGELVKVYAVLSVSDAGVSLFGFSDAQERDAFNKLVSVKGIGPKAALSVLSTLNPGQLSLAIATADDLAISQAPGIGKKSAQRIILELKGSIEVAFPLFEQVDVLTADVAGAADDAQAALLSMSFTPQEISLALRGWEGSDAADGIRYALSRLGAKV